MVIDLKLGPVRTRRFDEALVTTLRHHLAEAQALEWLHLTVRNDDEQRVRQTAREAEIRVAVSGGPEHQLS